MIDLKLELMTALLGAAVWMLTRTAKRYVPGLDAAFAGTKLGTAGVFAALLVLVGNHYWPEITPDSIVAVLATGMAAHTAEKANETRRARKGEIERRENGEVTSNAGILPAKGVEG